MIHLARYILIFLAVIGAPFYGLWVLGGWIADKLGQRRTSAMMKGMLWNARKRLNK